MEFAFDRALSELHDLGLRTGLDLARPTASGRDRDARWEPDLFAALADAGLTRTAIPAAYHGLGHTALATSALFEGFGQGAADPGLALALSAHALLIAGAVTRLGTAEQRRTLLPGMAQGSRIGAIAPAEAFAAADRRGPGPRAERVSDGWVLDGDVADVCNAPVSDVVLLTARTGLAARTAFLVDSSARGVEIIAEAHRGALRTAPIGTVRLTRCHVPDSAVLGTSGAASVELVPLLAALDRTVALAPWLGLLRELATRGLRHSREGVLFGAPPERSQSVRLLVVDFRTRAELASGLLHRAAWQLDQDDPASRADAAAAKAYLVEALQETATQGVALGVADPDGLLYRVHRDVAVFAAMGGGGEVLRAVIADASLRLRRPTAQRPVPEPMH